MTKGSDITRVLPDEKHTGEPFGKEMASEGAGHGGQRMLGVIIGSADLTARDRRAGLHSQEPEQHSDTGCDQESVTVIPPANSPASDRTAFKHDLSIRPANKPGTLQAVLDQMTEQEAGLQRNPFPASQLRVEADRLIAGDREFRIGNEGLRRLCKWFRAPADYLASLKPQTRARVLQDHFAEGRHGHARLNDGASYVLSRDGTFLDLGRSDLLTLDNATVVEAVREGIGEHATELEVQNLSVDDESFTLEIVSSRIADEVRPGDVLRGGVHVTHSQLEGEATQVLAYVNRLVCSNGLVQRQCVGEKRRSTPRTRRLSADRPEARDMQRAQIRKLVAETWEGLSKKLDVIRRLQDKSVEVRPVLERFLRQAHLYSQSLMERLLEAWEIEGSEPSAFGALNALTRVATHSAELPSWQRQRLSRLAGVYANQDVHLCPHCFSVLATR